MNFIIKNTSIRIFYAADTGIYKINDPYKVN